MKNCRVIVYNLFHRIVRLSTHIVVLCIASILSLIVFNLVLLKLTGSNHSPLPWSFISILIHHTFSHRLGIIFFPFALAFIISSIIFIAIYLWHLAGEKRTISYYLITGLSLFIFINWLIAYSFVYWHKLHLFATPWLTYLLFISIPKGSLAYKHLIACFIFGYGLLAMTVLIKIFSLQTKAEKVFGKAHFANSFEIKKAGLFAKEGIIIGKACGRLLRLPGFESLLLTAPTGSGKTTAIALPNLLNWSGSVVVNDLKGELFQKTAQYRAQELQNKCFVWAPANEEMKTDKYNPFVYVSSNPNLKIRDIQLIAETLIPAEKLGDAFWYQSSREIFMLLALYLIDSQGIATLSEIHDLAKQADFVAWLNIVVEEKQITEKLFYQNAYSILNAEEKTQRNILKDFHSRIALFSDPIICHATSGNDFDLRKLRQEKMSIYINIPIADKERLKPILTLFWTQLINLMSQKEPNIEEEPYPVLALMDEFGNMAKIEKLQKGISFLRAYRVRCIIIVQYLAQLYAVYGKDEAKAFLNTKAKMAFALNDIDDACFFSKAMGARTVKVSSSSVSNGYGDGAGHQSENMNFQSRALMTPDEIMQLHPRKALILLESAYPIIAKKYVTY